MCQDMVHGLPGQSQQRADNRSDETGHGRPGDPGQDRVMGEFLGPLDDLVQRVEADLGEVDRQDVATDPQHRHGADDPDAAEERRRRLHDRSADGPDGARAALTG